jgi:hypothetical protein
MTQEKPPRNFEYIVVDTEDARDAETIDKMHRKKGWKKNAWHFVITDGGTVQSADNGCTKVRGLHEASATVGACGPGYNGRTIGICLVAGDRPGLSPEQEAALGHLIAELAETFSIPSKWVMTRQQMYDLFGRDKRANSPALELPERQPKAPHVGPQASPAGSQVSAQASAPSFHTVVRGDTLESIAEQYGVSVEALCVDNKFVYGVTRLVIGQNVYIPS